MSKQSTETDGQCEYCAKPALWEADFSDCTEERYGGIAARGHFLKRIENPHYPVWPVQCIFRQKGNQHSKLLIGREHFGSKWHQFNVEILGLTFPNWPPMPPEPLFGVTRSFTPGVGYSYILWNACKITSEQFEFVVKLHWWPNHDRRFIVDRFHFDSAAEAAALNDALLIFSRGRGRRPMEYFTSNKEFNEQFKSAVIKSFENRGIPTQIEIAEDLFPEAQDSARELRRWLRTSWRKWQWKDIVKAIVEDDAEKKAASG
jgi:hypothetical protein